MTRDRDPICTGRGTVVGSLDKDTPAVLRDGRRCRKHAMWIVDGDPLCDWHRREYPYSRLPARSVRA
jgi:hypothetical protein